MKNEEEFLTDIKAMRKFCETCGKLFYYSFSGKKCGECEDRERYWQIQKIQSIWLI